MIRLSLTSLVEWYCDLISYARHPRELPRDLAYRYRRYAK